MFYNSELVSQTNRERLQNLVTDRLTYFDLLGNEIDPEDLTEEGSCADLFRRHTADLISSDLQFHIKGQDSESYVTHFSRTKFKKFERSADFLRFLASQVHLLFNKSDQKPLSLMQNSDEVMTRFENQSRQTQLVLLTPVKTKSKENNGFQEEKASIKAQLREALEDSVSPRRPFPSGRLNPKSRAASHQNLTTLSSQTSFFQSLKRRSNSLDSLRPPKAPTANLTTSFHSKERPSRSKLTKVIVGENTSPVRTFISPAKKTFSPAEPLSPIDLAELFETGAASDLYRSVTTAGGRQLIEKPLRAILAWLDFDKTSESSSEPDQAFEIIKINEMHLALALMIHDFRTTRVLHNSIENFNRKDIDQSDRDYEQIKKTIERPGENELKSRKADEMAEKLAKAEKMTPKPVDLSGIQELTESKSEITPISPEKAQSEPEKILEPETLVNQPVSNQPVVVPTVISTETIMAQQMTILTQMMAIMTQNMAQQSAPPTQYQPTQVTMRTALPQGGSKRIISPRTIKENVNRSLQKVNGLPLLELPGTKKTQPAKYRRTVSHPVPVKSVPVSRRRRSENFQLLDVQKPGSKVANKNKFQLLELNKVAKYVSDKNEKENQTKRKLIGQKVISKAQNLKPKVLPEKKKIELVSQNDKEIEREKPESEKRPNMVLIDYDRISRDIRNQLAETDRQVHGEFFYPQRE